MCSKIQEELLFNSRRLSCFRPFAQPCRLFNPRSNRHPPLEGPGDQGERGVQIHTPNPQLPFPKASQLFPNILKRIPIHLNFSLSSQIFHKKFITPCSWKPILSPFPRIPGLFFFLQEEIGLETPFLNQLKEVGWV